MKTRIHVRERMGNDLTEIGILEVDFGSEAVLVLERDESGDSEIANFEATPTPSDSAPQRMKGHLRAAFTELTAAQARIDAVVREALSMLDDTNDNT